VAAGAGLEHVAADDEATAAGSLGTQGLVVGGAVAEQRERLAERAAADDDLRTAVADQVQAGEVLLHPDRISHSESRVVALSAGALVALHVAERQKAQFRQGSSRHVSTRQV
jgi:hypothetical protein